MTRNETENRICEKAGVCGGCLYQGVPYGLQLKQKEGEALAALRARDVEPAEYLGIEGAPSVEAYRNKMEYTFGDEVIGGPMTLGLHKKEHFMCIVDADRCRIVPEDFNRVLRATLDFCNEKGYGPYHKKRHTGLMRFLILRAGFHTGELLVNIVTTSPEGATGEAAIPVLLSSKRAGRRPVKLPDPASYEGATAFDGEAYRERILGLGLNSRIVGILHTFCDSVADDVIPDRTEILYGRDYYRETVLGLSFRVSAFSFFQTSVPAAERLYREAVGLLDDVAGKRVFDLYCGTGTITQTLAKSAKEAVGVEIVEDAVRVARESAAENGLTNCRFIAGDVLDVLGKAAEAEKGGGPPPDALGKPDVIVVDPPRGGIHPKAWQNILNYGVKEILYISCSPKSLAANLEHIGHFGYSVAKLKLYDNFPFTRHCEAVALLTRTGTEQKG